MIRIALELRPDQATLVAERESEITTEGGLNVVQNLESVKSAIHALSEGDIQVSLFIDPDPEQVDTAADLGAVMIELNTRAFSEASPKSPDLAGPSLERELMKLVQAAERGKKKGLKILRDIGLTITGCFDGCIGCRKCEEECPENALTISESGSDYIVTVRSDLCNGTACLRCDRICPEKVFMFKDLRIEEKK